MTGEPSRAQSLLTRALTDLLDAVEAQVGLGGAIRLREPFIVDATLHEVRRCPSPE